MHIEYEEFLKITSACLMLFTVWEDQFEQFREILRDLAKKRGQEKIPLRVCKRGKKEKEMKRGKTTARANISMQPLSYLCAG